MSSSDGRPAAGEAGLAAAPPIGAADIAGGHNGAADSAGGADVPAAAESPDAAAAAGFPDAARPAAAAEWFLRAGRAGLLPDSMTVSSGEDESGEPRSEYPARVEAAGAPPWAGETTGSAVAVPPPWETGPWPGPGGERPAPSAGGTRPPAASRPQASAPWPAGIVLASGLVPLVIPGLVVGVLSARRSKSGEPVRRASILAIAASLAWAVVIITLVVSSSGGPAASCTYPAAVQQAYARVMADLRSNAPASSQAADLGLAVSRANASAAATTTGQVPERSALFAMAGDLQQARAYVVASRAVPASLREHLAADGGALTASCPS